MRNPARILIADDNPANVDILATRLESQGYEIVTATDGEEALAAAREQLPDLILLDIMMPKIDGLEVCRQIKSDHQLPFMPIILVTAKSATRDVVEGLDSGADEYLIKPVDHGSLVARVRSILRIKALHDTVEAQSAELADWNRQLESRVADQLSEIERMSRLKRFLSPQVPEPPSVARQRTRRRRSPRTRGADPLSERGCRDGFIRHGAFRPSGLGPPSAVGSARSPCRARFAAS